MSYISPILEQDDEDFYIGVKDSGMQIIEIMM